MPQINVLSKEISELIAAGEVIERPSSVIKELVENSIDSGAKHITVEIKNGGTTYMRVSDDGCGMSFDDVPTAFLRHATSKIVSRDDLDNICTLGFRGEALASISAVARVEVMTKQKEEMYGTLYEIEGSIEKTHEKSGCPEGTTIIIRDLFYNVPARAKFMKKDVTEANAVSQIMQKITLSNPDVSFRMIRDNRLEFNSSGDGELFSAVYAVYGRDFARDMISVDYEYNGVHVSGYTVKPLYSRNNRSFQNFFVNGRYVRSKLCSAALENGYTNLIMTGKFPACVLMIDLAPSLMDVNIHPAKAEVRFTDEKNVSEAVFFAIKNALMNDGLIYEFELKPKVDWNKPVPVEDNSVQQEIIFTPVEKIAETEKILNGTDFSHSAESVVKPKVSDDADDTEEEPETAAIEAYENYKKPFESSVKSESVHEEKETEKISGFSYINKGSFTAPAKPVQTQQISAEETAKEEFSDIKVIGEAFGLYVICESGDKMIIIDKHAAHERIIFERLKSRNCRQYSQKLLVGIKVLLTADEYSAIQNNTELLADMGFEFEMCENSCVTATAVPTFAMELDLEDIVCEIAHNLSVYRNNPQSEALDDMLHTVACKSAIKANDRTSAEEMKALAEQVCNDERIRHCPHGRPVMFTMTKYNIDHQFRRT